MSQGVFTFLHLSDIHFRRWSGDRYDLDVDLRSQLEIDVERTRKALGLNFDGILVTGDVAFSGKTEEFEIARTWLSKLCADLECKPENVWVTPGNHDFDRHCVEESPALCVLHETILAAEPRDVAKVVGSYCRDPAGGAVFYKPLENYNNFAAHFGCAINHERPYWETKELMSFTEGTELRLRGLNTVLVSSRGDKRKDDNETGNLLLGAFQVPAEIPAVEYVTLCHHPPNWLRDESEIDDLLRQRVRIQLFGHTHDHHIESGEGFLRLFAGAVHPKRDETWFPRYNILQIGLNNPKQGRTMTVQIYPRVWQEGESRFGSEGGGEFDQTTIEIQLDGQLSVHAQNDKPEVPMDESHDRAFDKKAVEPSLQTAGMREATYRYLRLSYYDRIHIAQSLRLLGSEDENMPDITKFKRILARVYERQIIEAFTAKIKNAEDAVS